MVGLGNVDNTSDANKPVSTAQAAAIALKIGDAPSDGQNYVRKNAAWTPASVGVAGTDKQVQFNDGGALAGNSGFTFDKATGALSLTSVKMQNIGSGSFFLTHQYNDTASAGTVLTWKLNNASRVLTIGGDLTLGAAFTTTGGGITLTATGSTNVTLPTTGTLATLTDVAAKVSTSLVGAANGVASLDSGGKVPTAQLPSYVDDVLEAANLAAFPGTGETGKIYVALDTNKPYRWTGSVYVEITASPGSTDAVTEGSTNKYFTESRVLGTILAGLSTATNAVITAGDSVLSAFGKLQKQFSDHFSNTSNPHSVTAAQVGLGNVNNTSDVNKPVSTAQTAAFAPQVNPTFTGTVTIPTASPGTNDTTAASTAYVLSAAVAARGGGSDKIFFENDITVNNDYTVTTNKNAMSAGPITIASGKTVTIPSGSTWTIV
jgi:hypothetical protein